MQHTFDDNWNSSVRSSRRGFLRKGMSAFFLVGALAGVNVTVLGQKAKTGMNALRTRCFRSGDYRIDLEVTVGCGGAPDLDGFADHLHMQGVGIG